MQIDPTTVDVGDVIRRIQAMRRGELPADSVSVEELRAAIEAQRQNYAQTGKASARAAAGEGAAPTRKTIGKAALVIPGLDDLL